MLRIYLTIVCGLAAALGGIAVLADHPFDGAQKTKNPSHAVPDGADEHSGSDEPSPLLGIDITNMVLHDGRYGEELDDGRRVTYTVQPELQEYADRLLEQYEVPAGAAVMLNSRTGRVLALSQRRANPSFAPSSEVALDPAPPAASLFKIVTTAALLERAEISPKTKTCYFGGSSRLHLLNLGDPPPGKGACVSLEAAFGRSVNSVFAKLSDRKLGPGVLEQYAKRFHFNEALPFDVPFAPSKAKIPTDRLERARTAAGFWHTHLSPLHAASIVQSLAQKGAMLQPYIVDRVVDKEGNTLHEARTKYMGHVVRRETAEAMMKVMAHTVRRGTARKAFRDRRGVPYLPDVEVAGKTGSLNGRNPFRAYTWFAGAAPVEDPEVAIAVLVINDPKWHIKASGAAALLLKKYFEINR